jgi:Pyruvate/2-oxoacid:ferredoxin oxidoreductase delta subunit
VGYFCCRGDDAFWGYLKLGYLFSPGHPLEGELAKARDFGRTLGDNITSKQYVKPEEDQPPAAIYRMERFLVNRWILKNIFSRFFTVDTKKCTRCGLCIKLCPTRNVMEGKDEYPRWGRNCLACFTCELKCPKDAVRSPIDWPIFLPLLYYNIRRASGDSALDYVRVIHTAGRTKLV